MFQLPQVNTSLSQLLEQQQQEEAQSGTVPQLPTGTVILPAPGAPGNSITQQAPITTTVAPPTPPTPTTQQIQVQTFQLPQAVQSQQTLQQHQAQPLLPPAPQVQTGAPLAVGGFQSSQQVHQTGAPVILPSQQIQQTHVEQTVGLNQVQSAVSAGVPSLLPIQSSASQQSVQVNFSFYPS